MIQNRCHTSATCESHYNKSTAEKNAKDAQAVRADLNMVGPETLNTHIAKLRGSPQSSSSSDKPLSDKDLEFSDVDRILLPEDSDDDDLIVFTDERPAKYRKVSSDDE